MQHAGRTGEGVGVGRAARRHHRVLRADGGERGFRQAVVGDHRVAAGDIDAWMMEGAFQTHAEVGEDGGELGYPRPDLAPAGAAESDAPDPAVALTSEERGVGKT